MAVYLLFKGAAHNKDRLVVACSMLFRGLIAAIYKVWAAKYHKRREGHRKCIYIDKIPGV